jgi:hypothetical protein
MEQRCSVDHRGTPIATLVGLACWYKCTRAGIPLKLHPMTKPLTDGFDAEWHLDIVTVAPKVDLVEKGGVVAPRSADNSSLTPPRFTTARWRC